MGLALLEENRSCQKNPKTTKQTQQLSLRKLALLVNRTRRPQSALFLYLWSFFLDFFYLKILNFERTHTSYLAKQVMQTFYAFTSPSSLQELRHILWKISNLNSKIKWRDSREKKAAKQEKESCPVPRGNVCFPPVSSCLQRDHRGSLNCFPPFTCLSIDLFRTKPWARRGWSSPPFPYSLTQWYSEPSFPTQVSSFCSLLHMVMAFHIFPHCWSGGIYFCFLITSFC